MTINRNFKKKVGNYLTSFWGSGLLAPTLCSARAALATGGEEPLMTPKALGEKIHQQEQQTVRQQVEAHPLVKSVKPGVQNRNQKSIEV